MEDQEGRASASRSAWRPGARAGFADATAEPRAKALALPPPADFLWQYVHSTPLAAAAAEAGEAARGALERDIAARWEPFTHDDG